MDWRAKKVDLPTGYSWDGLAAVQTAPGELTILVTNSNYESVLTRVRYFDASAVEIANLGTDLSGDMKPGIGAQLWLRNGARDEIRAFSSTGQVLAAPKVVALSAQVRVESMASDPTTGNSFLLQNSSQAADSRVPSLPLGPSIITAISPLGQTIWQQSIAELGDRDSGLALFAGNGAVCVQDRGLSVFSQTDRPIRLWCFRQADGSAITQITTNEAIPSASDLRARMLATGELLTVVANPQSLNIATRRTNQATQRSTIAVRHPIIHALALNGTSWTSNLKGNSGDENEWRVYAADGIEIARFDAGIRQFGDSAFVLPDGGAILTSLVNIAPRQIRVERRSAQGQLVWQKTENSADETFLPAILAGETMLIRRGFVSNYSFGFGEGNTAPFNSVLVAALDVGTGATLWQRPINYSLGLLWGYQPANGRVIAITGTRIGLMTEQMSVATGQSLSTDVHQCATSPCTVRYWAADENARVKALFDLGADAAAKSEWASLRFSETMPSRVALDQSGLSGVWHTPKLRGQGLSLQYFEAQHLLFATWFHELHLDSNDLQTLESQSRWYTLSGTLTPGATTARLSVYENSGGQFATGPSTAGVEIGTAVLSATNCNEIQLRFNFASAIDLRSGEPNVMFSGLRLQRLAGAFSACKNATNQAVAPQDFRPANAGFDVRQSGAWTDANRSGQGLALSVQPPTSGASGLFFGSWFTYDATPNDSTNQDWFTLSGETQTNSAQNISFVIYRTMGGALARRGTGNSSPVGQGSLRFSGCDQATLSYQFDDTLLAGQHAGRVGVQSIEKIAGCGN